MNVSRQVSALKQAQAVLRGLTFRDTPITHALEAIHRALEEETECPRGELVVAVHTLASHYENALGAFGDDAEGRCKAEGDIAYAMKVAARHNYNGCGCRGGECESKPAGCRMVDEVSQGGYQ